GGAGVRHGFHADCIDLWLAAKTTCPICRTDIEPKSPTETIPPNPPIPHKKACGQSQGDAAVRRQLANQPCGELWERMGEWRKRGQRKGKKRLFCLLQ
ncbi:hypothetical protein CLOP_g19760, partial [Closterium sp. NIES-67]